MDKITATAAALREILGGPVPAGSSVQIDLERGKLTMNHGGGPAESYGRPSSCGACLAGKQLPLGEQAAERVVRSGGLARRGRRLWRRLASTRGKISCPFSELYLLEFIWIPSELHSN